LDELLTHLKVLDGSDESANLCCLQIDFLDLSRGPPIWMNSTIPDGEALKILTM
jgi:hypothetical protein